LKEAAMLELRYALLSALLRPLIHDDEPELPADPAADSNPAEQ
jgi:hypothetical protein